MIKTLAVLLAVRGGAGFKAQMSQASGSVKKFEKDVEGSGSRTSKVASGLKTAFAGLAVAAALFFANAINQAVQFEGAMRNVNSISYLSEKQLATLSNQVIALSTRVPQSATNLAEGLYDIASSGFQGAEGMKVLEASAVAASAGLSTTATAAKAITQVLNAYGLSADHATDVSDVLFQTVNLGVVSFEELASQLGDVVGGAAAAGVAIDEVGAAVAAMTLSGLGAAEATTSLNNLIRSLIKPSDGLAAAYQNLGIESGEAELKQKGLHGVMEELREATHGNITTLIQLFPEIRAARGAFALMAADGSNYAKTFRAITDEQTRAGATQRAFNEQMKGLGQQWKLFMNQVNAASLRIGLALIPALKEGLAAVRDFGTHLGNVLRGIGQTAAPAFRRVQDALKAVAEALKTIGEVVKPVAVGLGAMVGVAILGGVNALALAIKGIATVLADHPALIQAVGLAYGSFLVSKLLLAASSFLRVQQGLLAIRLGLAALTAQEVLGNFALRLSYIGDSIYAIFSTGNLKNLTAFTTAFEGLGPAAANFAVGLTSAGAIVALYALTTGLQNASKNAKQLRDEIEKDIDFKSLSSIRKGINDFREEYDRLNQHFQDQGGRLSRTLQSTFELLTPQENDLVDTKKALDALADGMRDASAAEDNMINASEQLKAMFGLTQGAAEDLLEKLDFDPTKEMDLGELVEQAQALVYQAQATTPALEGVADATEEVSDVTSTAADKVGALEGAMKSLFGVAITAREAESKLAGSIQALGESVDKNGLTFDVWTAKGRENEDALRGNIEAMIDLANATAAESGSVEDGVNSLGLYRQQLLDNLTSMGLSQQAAEDLLATYGLTPANLATLVTLEGADTAQGKLADVQGLMEDIGRAQIKGEVRLDSEDFDNDARAISEWIEQIAIAAPEATVYLDGEPFQATAAQVSAWSREYEDSSPEAKALLNVIDPQGKYHSLSEAAEHWDNTSTEGTATLDNQAANPMQRNKNALAAWNVARGSGYAGLHDNASSQLHGILSNLNSIDGRSVHATVSVNYQKTGDQAVAIQLGKERRWGGIHVAALGASWEAGVYNDPTIFFGERETGGEAMIPRLGMKGRSVPILKQAAGWYGMDVVPRGSNGGQYMSQVTNLSFNVDVRVRADAGVDRGKLVKEIERSVSTAVDKHTRTLVRELTRR